MFASRLVGFVPCMLLLIPFVVAVFVFFNVIGLCPHRNGVALPQEVKKAGSKRVVERRSSASSSSSRSSHKSAPKKLKQDLQSDCDLDRVSTHHAVISPHRPQSPTAPHLCPSITTLVDRALKKHKSFV